MVNTWQEQVLDLCENFCTRIVFSSPTSVVLEAQQGYGLLMLDELEAHGYLAQLRYGPESAPFLRISGAA